MVTSVMRVGDTAAIALDAMLLELSGLQVGHAVRVQWKEDGTLIVTPLGRVASREELAASIRRVGEPGGAGPEPEGGPASS